MSADVQRILALLQDIALFPDRFDLCFDRLQACRIFFRPQHERVGNIRIRIQVHDRQPCPKQLIQVFLQFFGRIFLHLSCIVIQQDPLLRQSVVGMCLDAIAADQ